MAQEVILTVEAKTADAVRNLEVLNSTIDEQKQILIELEKELYKVEAAQKNTSKANLAAQTQLRQEADHLKDSIKDQRLALKELNLQQQQTKSSLDGVSHSSQKVASSFEDVAANGGAIAILDALTGGLASRIRDAFEATKLFNLSLKGTKTALLATGVGAIVVALGTIVAYWDDIVGFIKGSNDALKLSIDLNKKNLTEIDHQITQLELQKQILEANGQSTGAINKQIEESILLRQEENRLLTENLKKQLEAEQAEVRKTTFLEDAEISLYRALGLTERMAKAQAEAAVGTEEQREKLEELNAAVRESETKQLEFEAKLAALRKSERDKTSEEIKKRREEEGIEAVGFNLGAATKELDERQKIIDEKLKQEGKYTENLKAQTDIRKELAKAEADARIQSLNAVGNVLSNFASLVGEQTGAGKAAAIAATLISTYQSAQSSYNSLAGIPVVGPALGAVAAGVAVASGLKQIQAIKAVKVPNARGASNGGGGVATPSAPSITSPSAAPQFNIIGGGAQNQLAGLLADQTQKPVKAYVVSNEVSTAQSLDRNIVEGASI